jgi:hypothetical protein
VVDGDADDDQRHRADDEPAPVQPEHTLGRLLLRLRALLLVAVGHLQAQHAERCVDDRFGDRLDRAEQRRLPVRVHGRELLDAGGERLSVAQRERPCPAAAIGEGHWLP